MNKLNKDLFKKVLIANRGEIAVRIIRACRELGIATVAVYSEVDRLALHVRMADEGFYIGPAPSKESYLDQDKLIEVARNAGVDAIHPGYGFLAENPEFAERITAAGLIFIGPTPAAMRLMGDKTAARQCMRQASVPIVPGTEEPLKDTNGAVEIAKELGYPVLLKAAAGGGGKGMRVVKKDQEMASAFRAANSEAESAFGDGRIYIEKYLEAPRHIEFQILADNHGNVVHLGERECSIQRRHQKVIEEAPSCILDEKLRAKMGAAAVKAAEACGYQNAGTIEFMVDKNRNFYFLEMNTRLQVEHPVTEMITGMDLVKEQIRIAAGESLKYHQNDIQFNGHAIESRIYAEDPANNFLPSTGRISFLSPPTGPGVRDDNGYYAGSEVTPYYDPLMAKLITWGQNRTEAIARMKRALKEYQIFGIETTIPFCSLVMDHKKFVSGEFDTHFIENEFLNNHQNKDEQDKDEQEIVVLGAALFETLFKNKKPQATVSQSPAKASRWKWLGRLHNLQD
ncbi:MAG: acetyl-CoA carboxylase biotin carboxylase subunit, partial [bacterium]